jgi:hypothetical protein
MKCQRELSIRTPEATSSQRAQDFNKANADTFYSVLKLVHLNEDGSRKIKAENIYNADETGFNICHKPHKVVAKRGKKYVEAVTSAQRGRNTNVVFKSLHSLLLLQKELLLLPICLHRETF